MHIANLKLSDGKGPFDLDRTVIGLFNEIGSVKVQNRTTGTQVDELHEVQNRGAIEYRHSVAGNDILTNFNFCEDGGVQRTTQIFTAGYLLLLGFDESAQYFSELKSKVSATLEDYLIRQEDYLIRQV